MTSKEQRIAIAEACGWKCNGHADQLAATVGWEFAYQFVIAPEGKLVTHNSIPDYLNDLNAMHDAEKVLTGQAASDYDMHLWIVIKRDWDEANNPLATIASWHATAAQRAEALLRTIGKWEEAKP